MATDDSWHYPRTALAERTLLALAEGPGKALTLFAPRRTGKTEFLRKDLARVAEAKGHLVVYVSFWQQTLDPLAVVVEALLAAAERASLARRARETIRRVLPSVKLSASLSGASLGGEFDLTALGAKEKEALLLRLDDLFAAIDGRRRKTIVMLDEVQELARSETNRPLVAALRTSFDTRSDGIRAVFTGSSRAGLRAMFSEREAPFFHFGNQLDLEPLGEAFVDHLIGVHERVTGRRLPRERLVGAFEDLHRSPFYLRGLIELLTLEPGLDVDEALALWRTRLAERLGYAELWRSLDALSRAVLIELASGARKPFGNTTREALGARLGTEPPSTAQIQTTLRRLARGDLLDRWSKEWSFVDEAFREWVLGRG